MPIMGCKPVPEEEIRSESSNGRFTMRCIKDLTQKSFSLSIKDAGVGLVTKEIQSGNFTFKQLKAATKDFGPANKIGEGGFGSVYK
ncbi:hypothetical protein MKW94_004121, partial [Papaver nudicaule]|nr:hypothetical protein [Papaver nudicaule]